MKTKYAIVTDGLWRKSLSTIRALGKAGYEVTTFGDSIFTTGFWSSYTNRRVISVNASDNPEKFLFNLEKELKNPRYKTKPVICFMEDESIQTALLNKTRLKKYGLFLLPPKNSFVLVSDKRKISVLAHKLKIPRPNTQIPKSAKDLEAMVKNKDESSFIIKPAFGSGSKGAILNYNKNKYNLYQHWEKYGPLIMQDKLPKAGRGRGVSLIMDDNSNPVASFVHERIYEYPVLGGPSTNRISIKDKKLVDLSIMLLQKLSWVGVAMVEWKKDLNDNSYKLIEVNPRFWGSLELAVRSGVNFPKIYADLSENKKIKETNQYKTGVICRWMIPGEILRYMQYGNKRESFFKFIKGLPQTAEEWDVTDLKGTISTVICSLVLVLNPKYWKYLKR